MIGFATVVLLAAAGSVVSGAHALLPSATGRGGDVASTGPGMLARFRRSLLNNEDFLSYLNYHLEKFQEEDGGDEAMSGGDTGGEESCGGLGMACCGRQQREELGVEAPCYDTPDGSCCEQMCVEGTYCASDAKHQGGGGGGTMDVEVETNGGEEEEEEVVEVEVEATEEVAEEEEEEEGPAPATEEVAEEEEEEEGPEPEPAPVTDGSCNPASNIAGVKDAVAKCKFQAPTSETQTEELMNFCNEYFFDNGGYMHFMTTDERSEMRCPANDDTSDGFTSDATASFEATVRLPSGEIGETDNYTWMQLHDESSAWVRLAHYGRKNLEGVDEDAYNYIWVFVKEGGSVTSYPMGPVPTGDFQAGIVLPGDGTIRVYAGDFEQTFQIDNNSRANYFKAGVYVQDGNPSDFIVEYKSLTFTVDSGMNMM